jgi:hypothetical protein
MRFGSKEDVVEEFNRLVQDKIMKEYVEKFEELKSLMNALDPSLPESYYISTFLSGLKGDIRHMLKIVKLILLMQALKHAKWQEKSNYTVVKMAKVVLLRTKFFFWSRESIR